MKTVTFQVYPDTANKYRWRLLAPNKKITASSGEAFASEYNARRACFRLAQSFGALKDTMVTVQTLYSSDPRSPVKRKDQKYHGIL